ncbi:MAG TPA: hypothetical protein VF128_14710 [Gemmatimonadaceae bacterium]
MRLDAVYVLAPKTKASSMPTRRAFVLAGITLCLGGACGYALGASNEAVAGAILHSAGDGWESSNDSDLDELRWLAVNAPLDELMSQSRVFIYQVRTTYPSDKWLWHGVKRITDALLDGHQIQGRQLLACVVAQLIEKGDTTFSSSLMPRTAALRRIQ